MFTNPSPYSNRNEMRHIYISYLPPSLDEHGLTKLLAPYGKILACKIRQERSARHGLITMETAAVAQKTVAAMDKTVIYGRVIRMSLTHICELPMLAGNGH